MPSRRVNALMQRFYGTQVNGTVEFFNLVASQLRPEHCLLDLGCGSGTGLTDFRGHSAFVVGCDHSNDLRNNQFISAGVRGDAYKLPFSDQAFDVVVMDFVIEHLEFPYQCAVEIARVLKPGGFLFFRTPNFYHYVSITAFLTPQWVHRIVVRRLAEYEHVNPFETFYRANTRSAVEQVFGQANLIQREIIMLEKEPYYLTFAAPAFLIGYGYERLVNKYRCLSVFRSNILGCFSRPS